MNGNAPETLLPTLSGRPFVPKADALYDAHLEVLRLEGLLDPKT